MKFKGNQKTERDKDNKIEKFMFFFSFKKKMKWIIIIPYLQSEFIDWIEKKDFHFVDEIESMKLIIPLKTDWKP